jgi:hypothetical protein
MLTRAMEAKRPQNSIFPQSLNLRSDWPRKTTDMGGYRDKGSSDVTREPAGPPPHPISLAPRRRVNLTLPAVLAPYYKVAGRSAEPRRSPKPGQREGRAPWEASAKPRELWIRPARAAEVAKNVNQ